MTTPISSRVAARRVDVAHSDLDLAVFDSFEDLLYRSTDMFGHDSMRDADDVATFISRNRNRKES